MAEINLNKAQINYFIGRVDDVEKFKLRELDEGIHLPEIPDLSREERLGQIRLGKAVLKEAITHDNCFHSSLLNAFEYEGEDVIDAKKLQRTERAVKIAGDIKRFALSLRDRFVLHEFKTKDEIESALKEFKDRNFAEKYLN